MLALLDHIGYNAPEKTNLPKTPPDYLCSDFMEHSLCMFTELENWLNEENETEKRFQAKKRKSGLGW